MKNSKSKKKREKKIKMIGVKSGEEKESNSLQDKSSTEKKIIIIYCKEIGSREKEFTREQINNNILKILEVWRFKRETTNQLIRVKMEVEESERERLQVKWSE